MSDSQIKLFKRKVFRVIDDITASEEQTRSSSGLTILTNSSKSDLKDSHIDMTHMSNAVGQMHTTDFYNAFSQRITTKVNSVTHRKMKEANLLKMVQLRKGSLSDESGMKKLRATNFERGENCKCKTLKCHKEITLS